VLVSANINRIYVIITIILSHSCFVKIMAMKFKFFYDFMSPLSRSLYILFEQNKIACEKIPVALRKGTDYLYIFFKLITTINKELSHIR
jgi:hypothetical protein